VEVKLDKRYALEVSAAQAWAVLADIRAVAQCMPGAQITEQIDDSHYKGTVRTKVGPAVMQFGGDVEVRGLDAAARSLALYAKGADRSGSSASMDLVAHLEDGETPASAVLVGAATVTVSGKLAQFGSRLLVPVSDAMLAQFADNFRAAAAALWTAPGPAVADEETTVMRMVSRAQQPGPTGGEAAAPAAAAAPPPDAPAPAPQPAPQVKELNALALLWTVFRNWLARLFRRRA
jgi:uncharacterized protein